MRRRRDPEDREPPAPFSWVTVFDWVVSRGIPVAVVVFMIAAGLDFIRFD